MSLYYCTLNKTTNYKKKFEMKKTSRFILVFALISGTLALNSCKKDKDEVVKDADGNEYQIVEIGSQTWTAENLKATKLNDGTPISNVTAKTEWASLNAPGYCWYDNSADNKAGHGALYNFHAVSTGKLCPQGWHVPTDADWLALENHLGGEVVAGGKMKETGTAYWNSPNTGATNDSGFNGRGSGLRFMGGDFGEMKKYGLWWSSTTGGGGAWFRSIYFDVGTLTTQSYSTKTGLSVRCIKSN